MAGEKAKRQAAGHAASPTRPPARPGPGTKQAARKLDRVSRKFEATVEGLRGNLEVVGGCLQELLSTEAKRERRRQFVALAASGALHDLQILAEVLAAVPPDEMPASLEAVHRYAGLAVSQVARAFGVQALHRPGETVTVQSGQQRRYDWSADPDAARAFPARATVLQSGWKCGGQVWVKPKLTRPDEE